MLDDNSIRFMRCPRRAGSARAALFAELESRLRADLAAPATVREYRRRHRLTIMRGIEILVRRRGRRIDVRGRCGPRADDWLYGQLRLERPLHGAAWACAWWWVVRAQLPRKLRRAGDALGEEALAAWINRSARRSGLLASARRKLLAALRLDPGLLKRARSLHVDREFGTNHYVMVWQHAAASRQRVLESETLWPLYGLLQERGITARHELGEIRALLRREGLTRGGWKALCRHGWAVWWPLRHCHEFVCNPMREVIMQANLLAACGRRDLPPPALTLALGRMRSMHIYSGCGDMRVFPVVRLAWQCMDSLAGTREKVAFARGPLPRVLTWWLAHEQRPRLPAGVRWAWLERRADAMRLRTELLAVPWETFGACRNVKGFRVIPLNSLHAVRSAGQMLCNCMVHARESQFQYALFLVRDGDGRACAMFSADYSEEGAWLQEVRARFNQPVDSRIHDVVQAYLDAESGA